MSRTVQGPLVSPGCCYNSIPGRISILWTYGRLRFHALLFIAFARTMPRDLLFSEPRQDALVASPESATPKPDTSAGTEGIIPGRDNSNESIVYRDQTGPDRLMLSI